jgi:hypothetical protein
MYPTPTAMEAEKAGYYDKGQMGQSLSAMANRGELLTHQDQGNHNTNGNRQESWATPIAGDWKGQVRSKGEPTMLSGVVEKDAKKWATPAAYDWNVPETKEAWEKRAMTQKEKGINLHLPLKSQVIHDATKPQTMRLNPRWVEVLMGLPVGWVMASCARPWKVVLTNCDCSETELCQTQHTKHS